VTPAPLNESPRRVFGRIAIVDDNPDDIFILQRQLRRLGITCPIATFSDGHDAMAFLRQTAETTGRESLPELLFLDINMPGATGFSVLCWLREQEALKNLKVVILSGTSDPGDVALATALTADAYLAKQGSKDLLFGVLNRFAPDLLPPPGQGDSASPFVTTATARDGQLAPTS
jgi:CheY-like chemotaxis protein